MRGILTLLIVSVHNVLAAWNIVEIAPVDAPAKLQFNRIKVSDGRRIVCAHVVTFLERDCVFAVMDDPEGQYDLASAAQKRGALAAVNGGYFHPDRTPLGLRIRRVKRSTKSRKRSFSAAL
jgi:hypothetical protein